MAVQTFIHDEGRTGAKHLPPQSPACGKVVGRPRLMPRKALLANMRNLGFTERIRG